MANLISYLPQFVAQYREIVNITEAEQPEFSEIDIQKNVALMNAFVETADNLAVERYEKIVGIIKNPKHTLDERKFAIIAKFNEQIPYTMTTLKYNIELLTGVDGYSITLDNNAYYLEVKVALKAKNNIEVVSEMIQKTIPANLLWKVSIIYNQHETLLRFTHRQLNVYTHKQLREEVLT